MKVAVRNIILRLNK